MVAEMERTGTLQQMLLDAEEQTKDEMDTMRRQLIQQLGAELILFTSEGHYQKGIEMSRDMAASSALPSVSAAAAACDRPLVAVTVTPSALRDHTKFGSDPSNPIFAMVPL